MSNSLIDFQLMPDEKILVLDVSDAEDLIEVEIIKKGQSFSKYFYRKDFDSGKSINAIKEKILELRIELGEPAYYTPGKKILEINAKANIEFMPEENRLTLKMIMKMLWNLIRP